MSADGLQVERITKVSTRHWIAKNEWQISTSQFH